MGQTFTLILTKGMHVVSAEAAAGIKAALATKAATVDIVLDPFGGACESRITTISVAHVVALTANPPLEAMPANVCRIGRRVRPGVS
jgi:hypothetical protein